MAMIFVTILVTLVSAGIGTAEITVEKLTQLTDDPYSEWVPSWSPDGIQIAFNSDKDYSSGQVWVMNADGSNPKAIPNTIHGVIVSVNAWNTDGTKVTLQKTEYAGSSNKDVYTINIDGTDRSQLTTDNKHEGSSAWEPYYGTKIAYIADADRGGGYYDIWIMNSDGSNKQQLTTNIPHPDYLAWNPDGTKIAFEWVNPQPGQIWVMNADGSGQTQLTFDTNRNSLPAWSPDGQYIAFASDRSGNWDIWMMELGKTAIPVTIDVDPDTLNVKSHGEWITAYIELPEGYDVNDIDVSTINLITPAGDTVPVDLSAPATLGDQDGDGIDDLMVKFDRTAVVAYLGTEDVTEDETGTDYYEELTITGELTDETPFEGSDTIRVIDKGKSK